MSFHLRRLDDQILYNRPKDLSESNPGISGGRVQTWHPGGQEPVSLSIWTPSKKGQPTPPTDCCLITLHEDAYVLNYLANAEMQVFGQMVCLNHVSGNNCVLEGDKYSCNLGSTLPRAATSGSHKATMGRRAVRTIKDSNLPPFVRFIKPWVQLSFVFYKSQSLWRLTCTSFISTVMHKSLCIDTCLLIRPANEKNSAV